LRCVPANRGTTATSLDVRERTQLSTPAFDTYVHCEQLVDAVERSAYP